MRKVDERLLDYPKPFVKWAGGKGQLIGALVKRLPDTIQKSAHIENYIEPFVGGGALFFYLKSRFAMGKAVLLDLNKELIIGYKSIQNDAEKLIKHLKTLEAKYLPEEKPERKELYYSIRSKYNEQMHKFDYENYNPEWIERASYLIFLNRTCYNGLFRQNKKGEFNVPFGRYKNPKICNDENIKRVGKALKDTLIVCGDFLESEEYIERGSFVYLDPPYRPLSRTSNFTSYNKTGFDDRDQRRLADFFKKMDKKGAYLMLSNSDPKNVNPDDTFFDILYKGYKIDTVPAKRAISCAASRRGEINELIITNY